MKRVDNEYDLQSLTPSYSCLWKHDDFVEALKLASPLIASLNIETDPSIDTPAGISMITNPMVLPISCFDIDATIEHVLASRKYLLNVIAGFIYSEIFKKSSIVEYMHPTQGHTNIWALDKYDEDHAGVNIYDDLVTTDWVPHIQNSVGIACNLSECTLWLHPGDIVVSSSMISSGYDLFNGKPINDPQLKCHAINNVAKVYMQIPHIEKVVILEGYK